MNQHFHAAVWIDHHEARVFHFNAQDSTQDVLRSEVATRHLHHKANSSGSGHQPEDTSFYQAVFTAVKDSGAVLIAGPASAKHELMKHIERHAPKFVVRVSAVETLDHPTDGELLAHARKHFQAADQMATQGT